MAIIRGAAISGAPAMKMNPVGWFEIPVTDMKRARKFYETVFGFELATANVAGHDMAFFPSERELPGSTGALVSGEGYAPSRTGTVVYFPVSDIEATLAKVEQSGGKTTLPKKSIGEHGFIAWFSDVEGNSVALHAMS